MTSDSIAPGNATVRKWGIYLNGSLALAADSVIDVTYKREYRIADYPMEQGAFQSYNKVKTPFDARIRMVKGGKDNDRQAFLNALETIAASLSLYSVVTPEITYANANITHYDYRRTSTNGVTLLTVDLWLQEVRMTVTNSYTYTQQASGQNPAQGGTVQAAPPTNTQIIQPPAARQHVFT